jgi:hypothetical protein
MWPVSNVQLFQLTINWGLHILIYYIPVSIQFIIILFI